MGRRERVYSEFLAYGARVGHMRPTCALHGVTICSAIASYVQHTIQTHTRYVWTLKFGMGKWKQWVQWTSKLPKFSSPPFSSLIRSSPFAILRPSVLSVTTSHNLSFYSLNYISLLCDRYFTLYKYLKHFFSNYNLNYDKNRLSINVLT